MYTNDSLVDDTFDYIELCHNTSHICYYFLRGVSCVAVPTFSNHSGNCLEVDERGSAGPKNNISKMMFLFPPILCAIETDCKSMCTSVITQSNRNIRLR